MSQPKILSEQQRVELEAIVTELQSRGLRVPDTDKLSRPKTPDELWHAVVDLTGYKIPRVAVCDGHVAPFDVFAQVYFGELYDVLLIGNRGGGKTTISGFLHGANSRWKPGFESTIVGATDKQAGRAYAEFKRFIRKIGSEIIDSLISKTKWWNGSLVEVITGTLKQVNGPHPHLAQFDEAELTTAQIFEEFQNMAQGDDKYPAQNLLTTTRKFAFGLIQQIVKRVDEDLKQGDTPEWQVRIFCVFETMREVPNCQQAPKAEREARLKELGMDPCSTCDCHLVRKGWLKTESGEEPKPRTFASSCAGRAFRSRGFVQVQDVHRRFKRLSQEVWEAQQECLRPDPSGLVHKWFLPQKHILPFWYPKPELGKIYRSWDWGGRNPHAVLFHQVLDGPVRLKERYRVGKGPWKERVVAELEKGDVVTFDEIYTDKIPAYGDLGLRVFRRTEEWQKLGYPMEIVADYRDPAGYSAAADVKKAATENGFPVPNFSSSPAPRVESVREHISWGEDDRLYIVGPYCQNTIDEYAVYHYPKDKDGKPVSEDPEGVDDHAMDSKRYFIWGRHMAERRAPSGDAPGSVHRKKEDPKLNKRPPFPGGMPDPPDETSVGSSRGGYLNNAPPGMGGGLPGHRQTRVRQVDAPSVRR